MKVGELIEKLKEFSEDQEIEICCYTSENDPNEIVKYDGLVDKNGNTPMQVKKEIIDVGLEKDGKTVAIG